MKRFFIITSIILFVLLSSSFVNSANAQCGEREDWEPYYNFRVYIDADDNLLLIYDEYDKELFRDWGYHISFKRTEYNYIWMQSFEYERDGRFGITHKRHGYVTMCLDEYGVPRAVDETTVTTTREYDDPPDSRR